MATASENNGTPAARVVCHYFLNGACREGARCQFSHNRNDRPSMVCRFYLRGNCSYGSGCRYDHVKPPSTNSAAQKQTIAASMAVKSHSKNDDYDHPPMVSLTEISKRQEVAKNSKLRPDAQEFVPSWPVSDEGSDTVSYAAAVSGSPDDKQSAPVLVAQAAKDLLCPYHIMGQCWYGEKCSFVHGDTCDLCNRPLLHPTDYESNIRHRQECLAEHERDMTMAFAVANSKEKQCGICMEIVMEKANESARRFGILPSCKHCFCLECIRQWRQAKQFENKIIRACPECRTVSDFVAPSTLWVEDDDEKQALMDAYKGAMKDKNCKYFKEGKVECPFGNRCFYRHTKPDGTVVEGDSPRTIRRRQRRLQRSNNGAGPSADFYLLWNFLEEREGRYRLDSSSDSLDYGWMQIEDELDMLSITDSESDLFDYFDH